MSDEYASDNANRKRFFNFVVNWFTFTTNGFLFFFYCEDGKRGAVSWLSLNAVEVNQTFHLLDVCRFQLFLWQFDGFFRKPLEDFPLSSIFNTAEFVHSACTSASVIYGATRLDSMYLSRSVYPVTEPFNVRGWICPPVHGSFPRLHYTVNNVHITVGVIMKWHVSISCNPVKLLDQTHKPWGPTLEILQKPWQEYLHILLTSFIEGAPYRKEDSTWHNGRW